MRWYLKKMCPALKIARARKSLMRLMPVRVILSKMLVRKTLSWLLATTIRQGWIKCFRLTGVDVNAVMAYLRNHRRWCKRVSSSSIVSSLTSIVYAAILIVWIWHTAYDVIDIVLQIRRHFKHDCENWKGSSSALVNWLIVKLALLGCLYDKRSQSRLKERPCTVKHDDCLYRKRRFHLVTFLLCTSILNFS